MALGSAYTIVWLDTHIGSPDYCRKMKNEFQMGLMEASAVPPLLPDPIDDLICNIREYGAPISFATNVEDALQLIETNLPFKKVIYISSATLGKQIIPIIIQRSLQLECYYIFCGDIAKNCEWAQKCLDDGLELLMFDFETDLLIRLSRDMSKKLIEEGRNLLADNPASALKYFEYAYALAEKAVQRDKPLDASHQHHPSTEHRKLLDNLIAEAKRAAQQTSDKG